jgi:phosphoribosylanthranilate isomerase
MKIKICGLTRLEDARLAHDLGAWALGFIFYPQSKRHIGRDDANTLLRALPMDARTTGVFVNQTDDAIDCVKRLPLRMVQLHGNETPDDCRRVKDAFSGEIIKAIRAETTDDLDAIPTYKGIADYILLDAAVPGAWGGTGTLGDWALVRPAMEHGIPVILAGGLNAENILHAKKTDAFAFDLAGGVEKDAGIKDSAKLHALFDTIRGQTL